MNGRIPSNPKEKCPRCRLHEWHRKGGELVCRWPWGEWDVNAAKALSRRNARARLVTISWRALERYAERDHWLRPDYFDEGHLAHVDLREPGIMGTLRGVPGRRRFLIEGQHRAVLALRERRPFTFLLLTADETERVTLRKTVPSSRRTSAQVRHSNYRMPTRRDTRTRKRRSWTQATTGATQNLKATTVADRG